MDLEEHPSSQKQISRCKHCGATFAKDRRNKLYCSTECRKMARSLRNRTSRKENPEEARARDRAGYRAKREQIRARQRRRAEKLRRSQCVSEAELGLFRADPLLEEKRGLTDVIVCRVCGFQAKKLPQHLISIHWDELATSESAGPESITMDYRRHYGYNKRARLCCASLSKKLSEITKTKNARRRHQGRRVSPRKFRKGRAPTEAAKAARDAWGVSEQQHQRMSHVRRNRARPVVRKKTESGDSISDWQIAKLRLEGREILAIAKKVGLAAVSIWARLHRIGFPPGKSCLFLRGEPVTEKLLHAHFEDLRLLRTSRQIIFRASAQSANQQDSALSTAGATKFLGVTKSWIYEHTRLRSKDQIPHGYCVGGTLEFKMNELLEWALERRNGKNTFLTTFEVEEELARRLGIGRHRVYELVFRPGGPRSPRNNRSRKKGYPLSLSLAGRLLSSMTSLREEFRSYSPTHKGGRPKALLPSEERDFPRIYRALKGDLQLTLTWAESEAHLITSETLGEWMCQQQRLGKLRLLLFWPELHPAVLTICKHVKNRPGGGLGPAERAKDFLSEHYKLSRRQLERVLAMATPNIVAA